MRCGKCKHCVGKMATVEFFACLLKGDYQFVLY